MNTIKPSTDPTRPLTTNPPKQWDAFPEPKGWAMQWDNSGLAPSPNTPPAKPTSL
jgi:hypothetical protein